MGRSSAGKSSLLRVLRGLWPHDHGRIHCDSRHQTTKLFFLPQKPFFTDGSLREQVVYPLTVVKSQTTAEENAWLHDLLGELGLGDLVRRCGGSLDTDPGWSWYDVLSPGEMQRLSFIRLFFHRPRVAFLDEATSALSEDIEVFLYQRCIDLNMTLVSVGHRENLKRFHGRLLKIGLDNQTGGWEVSEIEGK